LSISPETTDNLRRKLADLLAPATELQEGLLVSATYDGDKRLAVLKFYDPSRDRVVRWEDNTGHKPYCFTKLPMDRLAAIKARKDVLSIEEVQKLDLLSDSRMMVRKITTPTPWQSAVALRGTASATRSRPGRPTSVLRELRLDRGLRVATYYAIKDGNVHRGGEGGPRDRNQVPQQILSKNSGEQTKFITEWADLLASRSAPSRGSATDIEVAERGGRIPDPEKADREVIAVSFHNDIESLVYLVAREGGRVPPRRRRPVTRPSCIPTRCPC